MIASLRIENFVLIDAVNIQFKAGFTVITGETGSGKSILLNALNLILGERANFSVIGNKSEKSTVEAEIKIKGFGLESFFSENELDYFDTAIVRREIHKQGRSRAFINDTPVQLHVLKEFSSQLIHIHSQYNTLELKETSFQLKVLDILAELTKETEAYKIQFLKFKENVKLLETKENELGKSISQADYNAFQLQELTSLHLERIDYESIQQELKKGENADEIAQAFQKIITVLKTDNGVVDRLGELKTSLSKSISFDHGLKTISDRINAISIEINDIIEDAESNANAVAFDPRKLDEMIAQMDSYNRILQKHRINSQQELVQLQENLKNSSASFEELKIEIEELKASVKEQEAKSLGIANNIHSKRLNAVAKIETDLKKELAGLKLENTTLLFSLSQSDELSATGNTNLEILFSPNMGMEPVPVHKAASGGELSRVMLALQSLMSSKVKLRTMLFDEIDTGVSGDVAQKMGQTLKKMGAGMQVIAITHLPQVAAKGGQHLKVVKEISNGKAMSQVIELNSQEKIEETARLMSGDQINQAALDNAKALMD
ncbi:MAG: AAA family ATPase [Fluviicola sp.]|nr:AAA family ATPase [Fluviicola sp.]